MSEALFMPLSRKSDIVIQNTGDETLIYDLDSNKALCLNPSATEIWQRCDGKHTIAEITEDVSKKLKSNLSEDFVLLAIKQLSESGLIEAEPSIEDNFSGMSRREIVKKIGLTSAIALPIIASIVAPKAINAGSACVPVVSGCQCNNGFMAGQDCTGSTQPGMACADPACRCIASPGFDDCMP